LAIAAAAVGSHNGFNLSTPAALFSKLETALLVHFSGADDVSFTLRRKTLSAAANQFWRQFTRFPLHFI
jgi:hypothetical protein